MSQVALESVETKRNRRAHLASDASVSHCVEDVATVARQHNGAASCCSSNRTLVSPCPAWKRLADIAGSAALITILLPVLLCVAAFIKCVSRGPVLFRQKRYGLGGRPFRVWKFRTIEVSAESGQHRSHVADLMTSNGTLHKRDHELDVISGGRLMRKMGIDELPQLFNVLKGEMSIIGPRPDVVPLNQYHKLHQRRFDVVPGITGLWQVSGKNRTTFDEMMQLDLVYVRRRSPWFDASIVLRTFPALFREVVERNPLYSGDGG
jgi:lipopolysaccharide/colanic/teichoic acid biosynthesis glycosyltransferase